MKFMKTTALAVAACFCALPSTAEFIDENTFIQGRLCVGLECVNNESFFSADILKIKSPNIRVKFEDTSNTASFPLADWAIEINERTNGGQNWFAIEDPSIGTRPFKILNNAPDNALLIDSSGEIGFGTNLPMVNVHVVGTDTPTLRMEQRGGSFPPYTWDISGSELGFRIFDRTTGLRPVLIEGSQRNDSLVVKSDGSIGLGTLTPQGKLHTVGNGVQLAYFESATGDPVQIRMRSNSQNRRFLAVNNANEVKSQIIFGDNDIRFTGATDSGANRWLTIGPTGIISQGPTCSGAPCDRTFDPEIFEVPPIEERAAFMWDNMHLPAVGPTSPDAPFNLTEKAGGMLHELEVAHIYIEQLHMRLNAQERQLTRLASVEADLAELKALVRDISSPERLQD